VYIISGRDSAFLEQHLGHLKNVGFSVEHGGFFRERGEEKNEWTNPMKSLDMSWMSEVGEIFKYYTEVCVLLVVSECLIYLFYLEDDGKSYRSEEKFDNMALSWK
jgi:Trehalose-phosphatase